MKYIGIVGSRRRNTIADETWVREAFLNIFNYGDVIVSGGCKEGGDAFAERLAKEWEFKPLLFLPDKTKLDPVLVKKNLKAAYAVINYARNTLVANASDFLIACIAADRKGGTEDTIKKFKLKCKREGWDIEKRLFLV